MRASTPLVLLVAVAVGLPSTAAERTADYSRMSLEELLQVTIAVATKEDRTNLRSSPAIVTLVTSDEIRRSGARELKDVLQLVPGLSFGMNDTGVLGLGSRGQWAFEAKALLLIDGVEMLDVHSGSFQFGNHYPVDQIDRIEIMRGPGSAIYGGSAELLVINIVTRGGQQLGGGEATLAYGQMRTTYARRDLHVAYGRQVSERFAFSVEGLLGQGQRSDRRYTDFFGNSYSMAGNSDLDPAMLNLGLSYRGLALRTIVDLYHTTAADSRLQGANLPRGFQNDVNTVVTRLTYRFDLGAKLSLEPSFAYKWNEPWKTVGAEIPQVDYHVTYDKTTEGFDARFRASKRLSLLAGSEFTQVTGHFHTGVWNTTGTHTKTLDTGAVYVQGLLDTPFANFNLGGRYEASGGSPAAIVPRLGATRVFGRWHLKALYAEGFKTPTLVQHDNAVPAVPYLPPDSRVRPERARVAEVEAGCRAGDRLFAVLNVFNTSLADAIVYSPVFGFENSGRVVTRGLEAELRVKEGWGYATLGYSYYRVHSNQSDLYAAPGHDSVLLGFPAHKLTIGSSLELGRGGLQLAPTLVWYGPRYGYVYDAATAPAPGLARFKPMLLVNLYLSRDDVLVRGVTAGIGVFNLFDEPEVYPQPYDAGHGPIPETSREVVVRIGYRPGS